MANGEATETRLARLEQRVSDLDVRVSAMAGPITTLTESVIRQTERFDTLNRDLRRYTLEQAKLAEEIERRDQSREDEKKEERRERRNARLALWTLSVMILCALIGAAAVLLTAGVH